MSAPATEQQKKHRYIFLDVLRGIAVLWMIQVHITNVLIDPALKSTWWFELLNISNGFVAPCFIFCAGAGLAISLSRKYESFLLLRKDLWLYLRRLGYILLWAYMMHVPVYSYRELRSLPNEALQSWMQFDVLHVIVIASLILVALLFIVRSVQRLHVVAALLCTIVFGCTLFLWNGLETLPLPAALKLALLPKPPTTFSFLPWSGYLFAGCAVAGWFFNSSNKTRAAWILVGAGCLVPVLVFAVKSMNVHSPWNQVWWLTSPGVHAFRLSGVVLSFGILFLVEPALSSSNIGKGLQRTGQESLFLYISHVLIVYGAAAPDLINMFGLRNSNMVTILMTWLVVTIPLTVVSWWWNTFKTRYPQRVFLVALIQMTLLLFIMTIR